MGSEWLQNHADVLQYLKGRFPMFHQSNVFFRDIQFGIQLLLKERGSAVSYAGAEHRAREFASALEREGVFVPVAPQTWLLNYPPFKTPVVKAPESARPAPKPAGAPAATSTPAGAGKGPASGGKSPAQGEGTPLRAPGAAAAGELPNTGGKGNPPPPPPDSGPPIDKDQKSEYR